jgi:hypothetical protein
LGIVARNLNTASDYGIKTAPTFMSQAAQRTKKMIPGVIIETDECCTNSFERNDVHLV